MSGRMITSLQPGGLDGGAEVGTVWVSYPAATFGLDPLAITGGR